MKTVLCLAFLFLPCIIYSAEPKWEYLTVSTLAAASSVKEPELKAWLREHRPQAYENFFGEKKKEEKKNAKDGDLVGSLMDLATAVDDPTVVAIDYYINATAKDGWELFSTPDRMLIFRREIKIQRPQ